MAFTRYPFKRSSKTFTARMLDYLEQSVSPAAQAWQRQVNSCVVRHQDEVIEVEGEVVYDDSDRG